MKTPIEQFVEKMEEIQALDHCVQVLILRGYAEQLKGIEKQHIVDAYDNGIKDWRSSNDTSGEDYYTQTFKK